MKARALNTEGLPVPHEILDAIGWEEYVQNLKTPYPKELIDKRPTVPENK